MKNLFLASSFAEVSKEFQSLMMGNLDGKTVSFIPTASKCESIDFYVEEDKSALEKLGLIVEVLDIEQEEFGKIEQILNKNDFIFVAGGNTFYLLQALKRSKVDEIIIKLINEGKLYIGSSAGAIVLAPELDYIVELDSPNKAGYLKDHKGLGVIGFSILPHFNEEPFEDITLKIFSDFHHKVVLATLNNRQFIYLN